MPPTPISRRQMLLGSAAALASTSLLTRATPLWASPQKNPTFSIGACDWSLGKQGSLESLQVAKEIGLDGVQVSFNAPGVGADLREETVRTKYAATSKETGVAICSLAMGVLNDIPLATEDRAETWVTECIETMAQMTPNPGVVLLAFFGKGDINGDRAKQDQVTTRLKRLAPKAEKAGVTLGIESYLNADDHIRILDAVGSPAVKVYYDVANMDRMGYDVYGGLKQLGKDRICEIHAKEYGNLIGQGKIDFKRVRNVLDEIAWDGWLVLEGATVEGRSTVECYKENLKYLRTVFPA